ncbi:MAG TPA: GIY-YIG nuclease family protein [Patescibacteria group bacterium]|nr:GIY-YIG nuclease family protein [Patescibacteria group bacterium]
MDKQYFVYILTNKRNGTLYTGVTGELVARTFQHKEKTGSDFTARYGLNYLVWFEAHNTPQAAITREKQIKKWRREWKIRLIEEFNPAWIDMYTRISS